MSLQLISLPKYFETLINGDYDLKWYHVKNPKKVELKLDNCNGTIKTYQVYLEDEMIGHYTCNLKKYSNIFFPTFFYINDTTFLVRFGFELNGKFDDCYALQRYEIWQDGKVIVKVKLSKVSFVNEISMIYRVRFGIDLYNVYYYNFETNETCLISDDDCSPGPFIKDKKDKKYLIVEEILNFEIGKIFWNVSKLS